MLLIEIIENQKINLFRIFSILAQIVHYCVGDQRSALAGHGYTLSLWPCTVCPMLSKSLKEKRSMVLYHRQSRSLGQARRAVPYQRSTLLPWLLSQTPASHKLPYPAGALAFIAGLTLSMPPPNNCVLLLTYGAVRSKPLLSLCTWPACSMLPVPFTPGAELPAMLSRASHSGCPWPPANIQDP